jgi:hypothetical protein
MFMRDYVLWSNFLTHPDSSSFKVAAWLFAGGFLQHAPPTPLCTKTLFFLRAGLLRQFSCFFPVMSTEMGTPKRRSMFELRSFASPLASSTPKKQAEESSNAGDVEEEPTTVIEVVELPKRNYRRELRLLRLRLDETKVRGIFELWSTL